MEVGDRVKWETLDGEREGKITELHSEDVEFARIEMADGIFQEIRTSKLELVTPALILEPGKEYVTQDSRRMRCISTMRMDDNGEFPVVMEMYHANSRKWRGPYYFTKDGHHKYSYYDIIGPWEPAPIADWSLYSKWTKAVAMDLHGIWYPYYETPIKQLARWTGKGGADRIPPEYAPKNPDGTPWEGNWEDSLCIRPEGE